MTRAALYARYSSDRQSDRSIEDQLAVCEDRARAEGWTVAGRYEDRALSGASLFGRDGLLTLMADAKAGGFDVVLTEHLDRLSRDQEDIAAIYKRLAFADVKIVTLAQGAVTELHIGLGGTMSALYLKDLADKTRRGLRGRVRDGRSGGGLTYGYTPALTPQGERGGLAIDEAQAAIVRRVFTEYTAGRAPFAIARDLNAAGAPAPRGGLWRISTLIGQRKRATGILRNRLYVGELVWGRTTWIKDPETGRRRARLQADAGQVEHTPVPHLAILPPDVWRRAQLRLSAESQAHADPAAPRGGARHPKRLLSGLVACGCCGGPYVVQDRGLMGCARRKESGACDNRRRIHADALERRVLDGVAENLAHPQLIADFAKAYVEARRAADAALTSAADRADRRAAELQRKVDRLLAKIEGGEAEGAAGRAIMAQLAASAEELEAAQREAAEARAKAPVIVMHPNLGDRLARQAEQLREALRPLPPGQPGGKDREQAAQILRDLVQRIVVAPDETVPADGRGGGPVTVSIEGELARLLQWGSGLPDHRVKVGAGTGFEPVTFRL